MPYLFVTSEQLCLCACALVVDAGLHMYMFRGKCILHHCCPLLQDKACIISSVMTSVCASVQIALFAGRRSSDRAYLLLQTWFCGHNLKNYIGSSSMFAFSHLSRVMQEEGLHQPEERLQQIDKSGWLLLMLLVNVVA